MCLCATTQPSLCLLSQNADKGWESQQSVPVRIFCSHAPPSCASGTTGWFSLGRGNLRTLTPTARCPPLPSSPASPPRVVSLGDETNPAQPSVSAKPALCPACPRAPSSLLLAGDPQVLAQPRGPLLPQGHPAPRGQVGGPASPGGQRVAPGKVGDTGRAGSCP